MGIISSIGQFIEDISQSVKDHYNALSAEGGYESPDLDSTLYKKFDGWLINNQGLYEITRSKLHAKIDDIQTATITSGITKHVPIKDISTVLAKEEEAAMNAFLASKTNLKNKFTGLYKHRIKMYENLVSDMIYLNAVADIDSLTETSKLLISKIKENTKTQQALLEELKIQQAYLDEITGIDKIAGNIWSTVKNRLKQGITNIGQTLGIYMKDGELFFPNPYKDIWYTVSNTVKNIDIENIVTDAKDFLVSSFESISENIKNPPDTSEYLSTIDSKSIKTYTSAIIKDQQANVPFSIYFGETSSIENGTKDFPYLISNNDDLDKLKNPALDSDTPAVYYCVMVDNLNFDNIVSNMTKNENVYRYIDLNGFTVKLSDDNILGYKTDLSENQSAVCISNGNLDYTGTRTQCCEIRIRPGSSIEHCNINIVPNTDLSVHIYVEEGAIFKNVAIINTDLRNSNGEKITSAGKRCEIDQQAKDPNIENINISGFTYRGNIEHALFTIPTWRSSVGKIASDPDDLAQADNNTMNTTGDGEEEKTGFTWDKSTEICEATLTQSLKRFHTVKDAKLSLSSFDSYTQVDKFGTFSFKKEISDTEYTCSEIPDTAFAGKSVDEYVFKLKKIDVRISLGISDIVTNDKIILTFDNGKTYTFYVEFYSNPVQIAPYILKKLKDMLGKEAVEEIKKQASKNLDTVNGNDNKEIENLIDDYKN